MRVVSLIASSTEIVCALEEGDRLVARSHECDYPPFVRALPQVTETKFIADGKSYEIDQRLKAILQEGLSVYRVRAEELQALKPDVVITQIQCEVCAVSRKDVEDALREWTGLHPKIVALNPGCLNDLWNDIRQVAAALEVPEKGEALVQRLQTRMETIARKAASLPRKPRVACVEWIEPLMAAGNWMPELITMAGGVNLFGEAGRHSPWMKWEELHAQDPDIILVTPCGWDLSKTRLEMRDLIKNAGWNDLSAVKSGQVYLADGNQFFNRPGPRLAESLEILAEIFHPETFHFGHQGTGWTRH